MGSIFLHDEKTIPPDEEVDGRSPVCERCGQPMWLTNWTRRANDGGDVDVRAYECKACGHSIERASAIPL